MAAQMMNKHELISRLETERAQLEEAIGALSPEQMTAPGAVGQWSVKDTLAHLAVWTARYVTLLYYAEQNQAPPNVDALFQRDDVVNMEDYESQKDRPLERVMTDFHGAHRQLVKRLGTWKEAALVDEQRFPWLRGISLAELLARGVAEQDAAYRRKIKRSD
jgi:hypothetical protein